LAVFTNYRGKLTIPKKCETILLVSDLDRDFRRKTSVSHYMSKKEHFWYKNVVLKMSNPTRLIWSDGVIISMGVPFCEDHASNGRVIVLSEGEAWGQGTTLTSCL